MIISALIICLLIYIAALIVIAFYTLLERKILGYIQIRKGPNKVGLIGVPQPFADALKLLTKEQKIPSLSNTWIFVMGPILSLFLALILWSLIPTTSASTYIMFSILAFLAISAINVYTTLRAGWRSNSKYSLLGALRGIAQTISYEVRMTLILLGILILFSSYSFFKIIKIRELIILVVPITFFIWFITTLAETNRTPFDFAEGESELVSGFNTEYRRGLFAIIFIAEYARIIIISALTTIIFFPIIFKSNTSILILPTEILLLAAIYIWARGTLPRIRYDRLINLTWKRFLPYALGALTIILPNIII